MTRKFSVFPLEMSPGFIIHRLDSTLSSGLQRTFLARGLDLTPEQWGILNILWSEEGLHQSELAVRSSKDRHNIARILQLMEKSGWIERHPDQRDKRRANVFLSPAGRKIKTELLSAVTEFLNQALAGLTEGEIAEMSRCHHLIIHNVENLQNRK